MGTMKRLYTDRCFGKPVPAALARLAAPRDAAPAPERLPGAGETLAPRLEPIGPARQGTFTFGG